MKPPRLRRLRTGMVVGGTVPRCRAPAARRAAAPPAAGVCAPRAGCAA